MDIGLDRLAFPMAAAVAGASGHHPKEAWGHPEWGAWVARPRAAAPAAAQVAAATRHRVHARSEAWAVGQMAAAPRPQEDSKVGAQARRASSAPQIPVHAGLDHRLGNDSQRSSSSLAYIHAEVAFRGGELGFLVDFSAIGIAQVSAKASASSGLCSPRA